MRTTVVAEAVALAGRVAAAALLVSAPASLGCSTRASETSPDDGGAESDSEVVVPAGPFAMGCDASDPGCHTREQPKHTVTLSAFAIDRTEVTSGAYQTCVTAGACTPPGRQCTFAAPDLPVACLAWDQASAYCAWAGKRLPTEAEWEKAARGTDGRIFPWGNDDPTCERANSDGCAGAAERVGRHPTGASPYGALDMGGNVMEWVSDWFDPTYYAASPSTDPTGPAAASPLDGRRAIRGGAWQYVDGCMRTYARCRDLPDGPDPNLGVRCARSLSR